MSYRLVVYNIEYCEGFSGYGFDYLKFWRFFLAPKKLDIKMISELKKLNPDILGLVEVDLGSKRSNFRDEAKYFRDKLKMKGLIEKVKYPYVSYLKLFNKLPILRFQGNSLLAKKQFKDVKYHLLNEGTKRVVLEGSIYFPKRVTILLAHLALGKNTRMKQIKELIEIVNRIQNPVILMGDFNTFEGEGEIKELLEKTHLKHKFKLDNVSNTLTQPAFNPKKRLDYVLTSSGVFVKNYQVLNFHFSDHLPVMVDFDLK